MSQASYLSSLTPLRGIAAVLIVFYHAHYFLLPLADTTQTHYMANGFLWVDFFFVLSGFILSHVYGKSFFETVHWLTYIRYMLARFARIYPLYLFTLIWAIAAIIQIRAQTVVPDYMKSLVDYRAIPTSLLLIPASPWHNLASLNGPAWSLCTEWWMYLLFPVLIPVFWRLNTIGRLSIFLLILGVYISLMYYLVPVFGTTPRPPAQLPPTLDIAGDFSLLRCLAGFTLGMLVYELYRLQWGKKWLASGWVLFLGLTGILMAMHMGLHQIGIVMLSALIVLSGSYNRGYAHLLLSTKPFQYLGDWSFSIYMVHAPLILTYYAIQLSMNPTLFVQSKPVGPPDYTMGWFVDSILVVTTLIVAALTYRFVEVPARNYLNARFKTRRKETIAL